MKNLLISKLRDKNTDIATFRRTAKLLASELAIETIKYLEKVSINIQTPFSKTEGIKLKNNVVLIPILRSGLIMLPAFLDYLESALIGLIGLRRDPITAIPKLYYKNLPKISKTDEIILLDPMIATGGSASVALDIIKSHKVKEEKISFVGMIGSPEGISLIERKYPNIRLIVAQKDKKLSPEKFIIPGLGDFGDRFFGTL